MIITKKAINDELNSNPLIMKDDDEDVEIWGRSNVCFKMNQN